MTVEESTKKNGLSNIVAEWLWSHLEQWVQKGIIKEEQKESIKQLYAWPPHVSGQKAVEPGKPVNMILALEIIGALLIGIGLITFIAFNWPMMAKGLKVAVIVSLIAAIHVTGFLVQQKTKLQLAGQVIIFLGNLAFGAGIWLIAQIYNLPSSFPRGMLIWALGVLPMTFATKSRPSYFLTIILFVMWTIGASFGNEAPQPIFLLVLLGILVPLAYYFASRTGLAICTLIGGLWLVINNMFWMGFELSAYILLPLSLYGLLVLLVSNIHQLNDRLKKYQSVYRIIGALLFGTAICLQPFVGLWMDRHETVDLMQWGWSFWISNSVVLAGVLVVWLLGTRIKQDESGAEIQYMTPFYLVGALYLLTLPHIKFSNLPTLFTPALLLGASWIRKKTQGVITLAILVYSVWLGAQLVRWHGSFWLMMLVMLLGTALYLYGWHIQLEKKGEGNWGKGIGLIIVLFLFFILTFNGYNGEVLRHIDNLPTSVDFWIQTAALLTVSCLVLVSRLNSIHPVVPRGFLKEERFVAWSLAVLPVSIMFLVAFATTGTWFIFLTNSLFLFLIITLLIIGYRRREAYLKALALIFIGLMVVSRYFEMDWSLFYKSILLVSTGIVILIIGILFEKNKEKVAVFDA